MNKDINYSISSKKEDEPVGYIKDHFSGECIEYFSEEQLLNDFEKMLEFMGYNGVSANSYKKNGKIRHGLKYRILETYADEFGLDYSKKEYEKEYVNINEKEDVEENER